jgi:hypothetical protein
MEEILYLIAGAAYLAFNFYKKSQEAKAEKQANQAPQRAPSDSNMPAEKSYETYEAPKSLEEMILERFGEKAPQPKVVVAKQVVEKPSPFLTTDAPRYAEGQRPRVERRGKKVQEDAKPKVFYSDILQEELDLKKAFVYNAIMQRPYA